jgi:uncharacterized OsmC-like protein
MNHATLPTPSPTIRNGVDVSALEATLAAIEKQPSLADFRFDLRNQWQGADENRSTIEGFYGAGERHRHARAFTLDNGEPSVLLGRDRAPNPLQQLLNALAACLTTSIAYHAAHRGIEVGSIESSLDGEIDLRGSLGIDDSVRRGFSGIRARFLIESQADAETLEQCARMSPVLDSISGSVPVRLEIVTR